MDLNTLSMPLVGKANKNKPSIRSLTTDQGEAEAEPRLVVP
jgi:hypothetical protein